MHLYQLVDSGGISNWSVTHVDWSERKWHPKSYKAEDVTHELLRNITVKIYRFATIPHHVSYLTVKMSNPLVRTLILGGACFWELLTYNQFQPPEIWFKLDNKV